MRRITVTLKDALAEEMDEVARKLGLTRSAFAQRALQAALERLQLPREVGRDEVEHLHGDRGFHP